MEAPAATQLSVAVRAAAVVTSPTYQSTAGASSEWMGWSAMIDHWGSPSPTSKRRPRGRLSRSVVAPAAHSCQQPLHCLTLSTIRSATIHITTFPHTRCTYASSSAACVAQLDTAGLR